MPEAPQNQTLHFGVFEVNLRARELRKHGVRVRLRGQPYAILAMLLERPGEVVTREELRAKLWTNDTFVDFEHSVNTAVKKLRAALNDSAENSRYVETIPKIGYRFIAPVNNDAASRVDTDKVERAVSVPGSRIRRYSVLAFVSVCAIGIAAVAWQQLHVNAATQSIRSIAVLPMQNLSGDPEQEYFADGMTEQLITDLAKVGAIRVISRTSVMRYKGTNKSLPEIARELNVDGIVEGSVMRAGPRVRITAQLLSAPTDRHLWAESYERDLGDVLKLQDDVAQAIARQVRAEITPQQQARLSSGRPVKPEAYDALLRGRYYLLNQFTSTKALNTAKSNFEEAIRKDPGFAPAYSGLAETYVFLVYFHGVPREDGYRGAKEALVKAVELDDNIGEIHDALGVLSWRFDWDWERADREFKRAIELQPSYSCAHEDRAEYLSFMGRNAEARSESAKSNAIDPGPSSAMSESSTFFQMRDYVALLGAGRKAVVTNPGEWTWHATLGVGYEGTGKLPEAISEYQQAVELSGGDPDSTASLAHAYAAIGQRAAAETIVHDFEQKSKSGYVSPYIVATVYAGLGEKDKAFQFLEKAYREKSADMSRYIKADLRIDNLRGDPRFHDLMHRAGLEQ